MKQPISETMFIGQFRHVIQLVYPCAVTELVKRPHGLPPTVVEVTEAMKNHLKSCKECTT
jgi:hypothetical protein